MGKCDYTETGKRLIVNLNGMWKVGESVEKDSQPVEYSHTVPVPGLIHSATPAFDQAGEFHSREMQYNIEANAMLAEGYMPIPEIDEAAKAHPRGISCQQRNYFWYRRTFRLPERKQHAVLTVLKAQYGSEIWINDICVGKSDNCFTSDKYDISSAVKWEEENEIVIRIGAHPGVLPDDVYVHLDFEKYQHMPGVWDEVEINCFDGPEIYSVQVAPKIEPKQILVQTVIRNLDDAESEIVLSHRVKNRLGTYLPGNTKENIRIAANAEVVCEAVIPLPEAELWCPENPALYILETTTDRDTVETRFGVREFFFRTATKSAYLNGKKIFLRGSQITLHRFFEDPDCGQLPWDEEWVYKLLDSRAKSMNWNFIKFSIGPVPRRWLEIADEAGMLLTYEFPVWSLKPEYYAGYVESIPRDSVKKQMIAWLSDICNYPSVVYFNSSLESDLPWMPDLVKEVRKYDLSNRAWGSAWNIPVGPDDPQEVHLYEFQSVIFPPEFGIPKFDMISLENKAGYDREAYGAYPNAHPGVITEFAWLFLSRNGNPTRLTAAVYPKLPYPTDTPDERYHTHAYLHAGLTEYWRAFRNYAGVCIIGYLAWGSEENYSSDYLYDVKKLEFAPYFEEYMKNAFSPLGVYMNYWQREASANSSIKLITMLCNDYDTEKTGELVLTLEKEDEVIELGRNTFELAALGQQTLANEIVFPNVTGNYTLKASARTQDGEVTICRRWIEIKQEEVKVKVVADSQFGQKF